MKLYKNGLFLILLLSFYTLYGQTQTDDYSIYGFITDAISGEALIGTNILLYKDSLNLNEPPLSGSATNRFGYYAIPSLSSGNYIIIVRYLGYKTTIREITVEGDIENQNNSFQLTPTDIELEEVVVEGERRDKVITSTIDVPPDLLEKLPTLSGEVDIFKSLELLPGVNKASEISSGLYVRGGSPDQTLTLVDGVIVYNPAHLGNIASTFNSNALSDIRLIKGAFPAEYGGRLSSVLDIKLRSGTKEKEIGKVGVGLINSYAAFEGPLDDNSTYMISGRVMYYDVLQRNFNKESTIPLYNFFDVNAKVNYVFSESSIFSLSALYSKDHAYSPPGVTDTDYDIEWQNLNLSLNWLQVKTNSLLLNSIYSFIKYNFSSKIGVNPNSITSYTYFSKPDLTDLYFRQNAELKWHQHHTLKLGFDFAFHIYDLLYSDVYNETLEKDPYAGDDLLGAESSLYFQNESEFTEHLKTNIGLRLYYFSSQKLLRLEPRLSASYLITQDLSIKGAFAVAHQFLHLIIRDDITLPTDLWYPSTENIQPSRSVQYVAGLESFWFDQSFSITVEGFYKHVNNVYKFKNTPVLNPFDNSIENQFVTGEGEAYGLELFISKLKGKLTGWLGYTLSESVRQFDQLNGGKKFHSKYDRRHDISIVLGYQPTENLNIGLTWIYASGQKYSSPRGQYLFNPIGTDGDGEIQYNFTGINTEEFPDYHKLDANASYSFNWLEAKFEVYVNLYNIYNRHNTFAQYVVLKENENGEEVPVIKRITLFPFIPSAGISVKF